MVLSGDVEPSRGDDARIDRSCRYDPLLFTPAFTAWPDAGERRVATRVASAAKDTEHCIDFSSDVFGCRVGDWRLRTEQGRKVSGEFLEAFQTFSNRSVRSWHARGARPQETQTASRSQAPVVHPTHALPGGDDSWGQAQRCLPVTTGRRSSYDPADDAPAIACPLCRTDDVEIVADIPAMLLCRCRKCGTAFTITPAPIENPNLWMSDNSARIATPFDQ